MPDRETNEATLGLNRRDILRVGAGTGVLGLTHLPLAATQNQDDAFLVRPYLQLGDSPRLRNKEQMIVMWHATDDQAAWRVDVRGDSTDAWVATAPPAATRVAVEGIAPHRVFRATLKGLTPGKEFEYRLRRDDQQVFASAGRARKARSQPVRCVVMADCGTGSPQQKQVAFQVAQSDPDFVLIPGDLVYNNGRISEYQSSFWPAYSPHEASPDSGAPLLRSVPFLGGLGQHDTGQTLDQFADGFAHYMYWSFPQNGPVREVGNANAFPLGGNKAQQAATLAATEDRYPCMANFSFDYGNAHWTVLDSWNPHIDWGDPQLREWLRHDLAATDATWKFVSSYLPPFNSSTAYPNTQKMRVIVDILQETGVDIVFCGYAHSFQVTHPLRFTPDNASIGAVRNPGHEIAGKFEFDRDFDGKTKTKPNGILYITTGGGGNPSLHSPEQTDNSATWQPYTVKYNASVNQFTDLQMDSEKLVLRQIDLNGKLIDEMLISK
ncbi:MAG: metallophosphoesterase family protein [Planctomycetota bacterium]|nr:metallophosphoesterase family protein [Planctomycetota bacterium]